MRFSNKCAIRAGAFLGLGLLLFVYIQNISIFSQKDYNRNTIAGLKDLEENELQVIVLGPSHAFYAVCPQRMYEREGITVYDLACPQQNVVSSYYLLLEALKKQSPQVVVLEASSIFAKEKPLAYRRVLDMMPFGANKLRLAYQYACVVKTNDAKEEPQEDQTPEMSNFTEAYLSAVVPMYYYHNRWKKFSEKDFKKSAGQHKSFAKGYWESSFYRGFAYSKEQMNAEVAEIREVGEQLYEAEIPQINRFYLQELKKVCQAQGIRLLVTKIPVEASPIAYESAWTAEKAEKMTEICSQYGIDYLDLLYDTSLDLDHAYDYSDWGHTNFLGACKVSDYLGNYLVQQYQLQPRQSDVYERYLPAFHAVQYAAELQLTYEFDSYLAELEKRKGDSVIFITAQDDMVSGLTKEEKELLRKLGLRLDFSEKYYRNSYIAVLDKGRLRYEQASPQKIVCSYEYETGKYAELHSSGFVTGSLSKCIIDGTDFAVNRRGLNIVVYDKKSGLLLDSAALDTYDSQYHYITHSQYSTDFLKQYTDYILAERMDHGNNS